MNQQIKEKVLYDSPEAATYKTNIEGWVSKTGRFWGKDEHMARWEGCTHAHCECGKEREKKYTHCFECRFRRSNERYTAMPFKEWDGQVPLVLFQYDKYFFNEDELIDYCEEEELEPWQLQLVICEPQYLDEVNWDKWDDVMPDEWEVSDLDKKLVEMVNELNKHIATLPPVSWMGGKFRTTYITTP